MGDMFTPSAVSLGILIAPLLLVFLGPAVLRGLWNLTLPDLFAWPRIGYWQAFRIFLIALLLFGLPRFL